MDTPHIRTLLEEKQKPLQSSYSLKMRVTVFYDDDVTEARVTLLPDDDSKFYGEGFAYCSPNDHYDETIGTDLAATRAMIEALREAEEHIIRQVITQKEYQQKVDDAQKRFDALTDLLYGKNKDKYGKDKPSEDEEPCCEGSPCCCCNYNPCSVVGYGSK